MLYPIRHQRYNLAGSLWSSICYLVPSWVGTSWKWTKWFIKWSVLRITLMNTTPKNLNDSGIKVFKCHTAYPRCACDNGHNLEDNQEILDNWLNLYNLLEAIRIDSAFTGDTKSWHYNTTAMLFSLFDVMFHRWVNFVFIDIHTIHKRIINMLPVVLHYYPKIWWSFSEKIKQSIVLQ